MDLALWSHCGLSRSEEAELLLSCNSFLAGFGLCLGREEALALVQHRDEALRQTGRLEFGESVLPRLLMAFRDSPFLLPGQLEQTLGALTEVFYLYKNECMDALTDDALLARMRAAFDGPCQGSVELLAGRDLWAGACNVREGRAWDWTEPGEEGADTDDQWD